MLLIGSKALVTNGVQIGRIPSDIDYICTFEQFQAWTRENKAIIKHCVPLSDTKFHVLSHEGHNYEFEIAWENTAARSLLDTYDGEGVASIDWCYALKMSHRYLKNSAHFLKTMRDIQLLKPLVSDDAKLIIESDWFKQREKETYTYKHPKLDVNKDEFFTGDGVQYVYDHDSLHEVVALGDQPAYRSYLKDDSEVMTSLDKFRSCSRRVQLLGGVEEAMVLCAERSLISHNFVPDPDVMFEFALQKLCTSISSGWFRESCWEGYDEIMDIYSTECSGTWVVKLRRALSEGRVIRNRE